MDDTISTNIQMLLSAIMNSEVYLEYKKQEQILAQNPELMQRVDLFRSDNFRLQNKAGREKLFEVAEYLARESAELRKIPEVNAYLDAELALCKMMQKICRKLTEGIHMHIPDF